MSRKIHRALCLAIAMTATVAFSGCTNYVKRSDFDAAISKLQNTDQSLQQQINSLSQDMQAHFARYDAQITAMQGRIRVDTVAHFAFDKAILQDQDKPMLDDFAKVMRAHHADAVVTMERFADPAGSAAYNKRLGEKRADAVRDYLVTQGGLSADQVRDAALRQRVNTNVHAPGQFRAQTVRNLDSWYKAFDVQPGTKLYLAPDERVKIW